MNIEIIIVDDGFTDRTKIICHAITDLRLRVYEICNSGVSAARNYGLNMLMENI